MSFASNSKLDDMSRQVDIEVFLTIGKIIRNQRILSLPKVFENNLVYLK